MLLDKHKVLRRAAIGVVLGLGAPVGYFVLASIHSGLHGHSLTGFCERLIQERFALFLYLTIPTTCVFAAFGVYTAIQELRLQKEKDRMEEFLHVAAHDIRSPLAVIREALALIEEAGGVSGSSKVFLGAATRQSEIMHELVTELLDIHRMEAGTSIEECETTDLLVILRRAVDEILPQLEKKQGSIRWEEEISQSAVRVNAFRIRQVMRNILGNAVRYMPSESVITIRLDKVGDRGVRVSVQNVGPHIPVDKIKTIFDKFTQSTIRDHKLGYGLGLVICKNIIEGFGGRIWAQNIEPQGVAFVFELPIAKSSQ